MREGKKQAKWNEMKKKSISTKDYSNKELINHDAQWNAKRSHISIDVYFEIRYGGEKRNGLCASQ